MSDNAGSKSRRFSDLFVPSFAFLLVCFAFAKIYSAAGNAAILDINDPLIGVSNRSLLMAVAVVELAVAVFMIRAQRRIGGLLVLWLCLAFSAYRSSKFFLGDAGEPCPCLGTITAKLPISPRSIDFFLWFVILYGIVGGAALIAASMGRVNIEGKDSA